MHAENKNCIQNFSCKSPCENHLGDLDFREMKCYCHAVSGDWINEGYAWAEFVEYLWKVCKL